MSKPKSEYTIQTVSNALRLLEAFREEAEIGVSELARRLKLHKNNVFRLLATLEQGGYVEQSPATERYRLGTRCLELGRAYARHQDLQSRARPILQRLVAELGESAHLGVLRDFEVVHLEGAQPEQLLVTASRVGCRLPAHCCALGKVLVGCAANDTRESYDREVVQAGLEAHTSDTITDGDKLFEHLRTVANQGFALDIGECEAGLSCAAAPVYDESGRLAASISVSGPSCRISHDELFRRVVPAVTEAADELSQQLGFTHAH
jgi:DNA-binding IclR family transcriptional regulator